MEGLVCAVCLSDFNETELIPLVLDCGHSFCSPCVTKLLDAPRLCPTCKRSMKKRTSDNYPPNYLILSLISSTHSKPKILDQFLIMKKKLLELKDTLTERRTKIASNLEIVESGLSRIQEFLGTEPNNADMKKASETLAQLQADVKKMNTTLQSSFGKIKPSVTISLESVEDCVKFLDEIYRVLFKGEQVIYVHESNNEMKYGKLSIRDNFILVHAVSLQEIPEGVHSVQLNDLKKCSTKCNFRTFLTLCCDERGVSSMVVIKMLDSVLVHKFVGLCTGECGPCYKGRPFVRGTDVYRRQGYACDIVVVVTNGFQSTGYIDYGVEQTDIKTFQGNDMVVKGESDGRFSIFRCSDNSHNFKSIIGKVTSPLNLHSVISYKEEDKLRILDSGFLLEI